MSYKNVLHLKFEFWLLLERFGLIAAQIAMADELSLSNQGWGPGRSKHHLFMVMGHDPVQIVTVPTVLPFLSKFPRVNCVCCRHWVFLTRI